MIATSSNRNRRARSGQDLPRNRRLARLSLCIRAGTSPAPEPTCQAIMNHARHHGGSAIRQPSMRRSKMPPGSGRRRSASRDCRTSCAMSAALSRLCRRAAFRVLADTGPLARDDGAARCRSSVALGCVGRSPRSSARSSRAMLLGLATSAPASAAGSTRLRRAIVNRLTRAGVPRRPASSRWLA